LTTVKPWQNFSAVRGLKNFTAGPSSPSKASAQKGFLFLFFIYVLKSVRSDKFYYGQTENLNNRLDKHNSGGVKSTAPYVPRELFA